MEKIGLFCSGTAVKTSQIAHNIREKLGTGNVDLIEVENAWKKEFQTYNKLIIGAATWFDGELPDYWDELLPELASLNLKGKKVAIFGLGDQKNYPDNFVDGMGILADTFEAAGATLVGFTSTAGYTFGRSRALRPNGKWCGLVIDQENQSQLTNDRAANWCTLLQQEFKK